MCRDTSTQIASQPLQENKMRIRLLFLVPLLATFGCSSTQANDQFDGSAIGKRRSSVICGPSDESMQVSTYDGGLGVPVDFVNRLSSATCTLVYLGYTECSGTIIGMNTIITAGHCLSTQSPNGNGPYAPTAVECDTLPDGTFVTPVDFPVVSTESLAPLGDYAILTVSGSPGATFAIADTGFELRPLESTVTLVGFPGGLKKVSTGMLKDNVGMYRYDADTEGGNSGCGVFDSAGLLIGVHTGGPAKDCCDDSECASGTCTKYGPACTLPNTPRGFCAQECPFDGFNEATMTAVLLDGSPAMSNLVATERSQYAIVAFDGINIPINLARFR